MPAVEDLPAPLRDGVDAAARLVYGRSLPDITDDEVRALPERMDRLHAERRDEYSRIVYGWPWNTLTAQEQADIKEESVRQLDREWMDITHRLHDRANWDKAERMLRNRPEGHCEWAYERLLTTWLSIGKREGWL